MFCKLSQNHSKKYVHHFAHRADGLRPHPPTSSMPWTLGPKAFPHDQKPTAPLGPLGLSPLPAWRDSSFRVLNHSISQCPGHCAPESIFHNCIVFLFVSHEIEPRDEDSVSNTFPCPQCYLLKMLVAISSLKIHDREGSGLALVLDKENNSV